MEQRVIPSYAKVNLSLDVREKRPEDGYHYIRSLMVPVSLADRVTLTQAGELAVTMSPTLDTPPEANLAFRAARLLQDVTGHVGGAAIHIDKVIPVAGGLAGGSTNAAAVLTGLNALWETNLTDAELMRLAIQLGSDVPFFIRSLLARVEGIGELVTPIPLPRTLWFVLATPDVAKSTGNVYRLFDELPHVDRPDMAALELALSQGDLEAIARFLGNVFEAVMLPRHPEIGMLKRSMLDLGAVGALMSGAGPTVFGLVEDERAGRILEAGLGSLGVRTALVHTVGGDAGGA